MYFRRVYAARAQLHNFLPQKSPFGITTESPQREDGAARRARRGRGAPQLAQEEDAAIITFVASFVAASASHPPAAPDRGHGRLLLTQGPAICARHRPSRRSQESSATILRYAQRQHQVGKVRTSALPGGGPRHEPAYGKAHGAAPCDEAVCDTAGRARCDQGCRGAWRR